MKNNNMALAALIVGILAFLGSFLSPYLGIILAIVAIVLGFVGISQINKAPTEQKGKVLAIIGIVLGALGIVYAIIYFVVIIPMMMSIVNSL